MEKIRENDKNFDNIKVFSSEDEKLKVLGELLSNKSSRDIIRLLTNRECYTNEIADKLNLRPNLVIHHLKKLEELDLLEINNKEIVRKGNKHRYFKVNPYFFLAPNETKEDLKKKRILENFFKRGIKFAAIGITAFISWLLIPNKNYALVDDHGAAIQNDPDMIFIPFVIIIIGLILERISIVKKEKLTLK